MSRRGRGSASAWRASGSLSLIGFGIALASKAQASVGQDHVPLGHYVDPMLGPGDDDQGDTIPGPTLPAGPIHPSPNTIKSTTSNAGYDRAAPLSGFAQLRTEGAGGTPSYGTFLVSPQTGASSMASYRAGISLRNSRHGRTVREGRACLTSRSRA